MNPPDALFIPRPLDYSATFLWALSGAIVAERRQYDVTGVAAIALVSSTGGGLLRDGLFLQSGPPALLRTPAYLAIVALAVAGIVVFGRRVRNAGLVRTLVRGADGFGVGAYAVVGMRLAAQEGLAAFAMVVVGMVNAVGGGLLRDVLTRQDPELFRPGPLNALAALPACGAYLLMTTLGIGATVAGWASVALAFTIRMASVRFELATRPLRSPSGPPAGPNTPGPTRERNE